MAPQSRVNFSCASGAFEVLFCVGYEEAEDSLILPLSVQISRLTKFKEAVEAVLKQSSGAGAAAAAAQHVEAGEDVEMTISVEVEVLLTWDLAVEDEDVEEDLEVWRVLIHYFCWNNKHGSNDFLESKLGVSKIWSTPILIRATFL